MNSKLFIAIITFLSSLLMVAQEKSNRYTPEVQAVARAMNSVVKISSSGVAKDEFNRPTVSQEALGSGVIIDRSGLVLTNEHVVNGKRKLFITLYDGTRILARKLFSHREEDLALLQIENPGRYKLQAVSCSVPDDLMLGETVLAIGNPYGLSHSVSKGILSSTNRSIDDKGKIVLQSILQTDISINPGNSGGPLINLDGEMMGINVASRNDAQGIGFAIPMSRIEKVLADWMSPLRNSGAELGFEVRSRFNIELGEREVYVSSLRQNSPAAQNGLETGDLLVSVDNKTLNSALDFYRLVRRKKSGSMFTVNTSRGSSVVIRLRKAGALSLARVKLGLRLEPMEKLAFDIGQQKTWGYIVGGITPGHFTGGDEIRRGDVIFKINGELIVDEKSLSTLLRKLPQGKQTRLNYYRNIRNVKGDSGEDYLWAEMKIL